MLHVLPEPEGQASVYVVAAAERASVMLHPAPLVAVCGSMLLIPVSNAEDAHKLYDTLRWLLGIPGTLLNEVQEPVSETQLPTKSSG